MLLPLRRSIVAAADSHFRHTLMADADAAKMPLSPRC